MCVCSVSLSSLRLDTVLCEAVLHYIAIWFSVALVSLTALYIGFFSLVLNEVARV